MSVPFSQRPGRHERHYRRRLANPLFPEGPAKVDPQVLLEAQERDHYELVKFLGELREVVQRAVDLRPNEDSEVVLALKADLDRLYELASGLADDQAGNRDAIRQLQAVVMRSVWQGASGDPKAEQELAEEDEARALHFHLLETPLVADLIHPDSVIGPDELAPTLLSADPEELDAALRLFEPDQLAEIAAAAERLCGQSGLNEDQQQRCRERQARISAALSRQVTSN